MAAHPHAHGRRQLWHRPPCTRHHWPLSEILVGDKSGSKHLTTVSHCVSLGVAPFRNRHVEPFDGALHVIFRKNTSLTLSLMLSTLGGSRESRVTWVRGLYARFSNPFQNCPITAFQTSNFPTILACRMLVLMVASCCWYLDVRKSRSTRLDRTRQQDDRYPLALMSY